MSALASVWMEKCQECRTWTSKSCCNILCSWHVAAQRKSSFRGSTFWETTCFFFFTKDKSKKVTNTCQPIYKGRSTQGISCSFNGIWLHSQLGQGLGWWCVFAGQQTFGFCLREHLKQRGFQDLACSVHTLFFLCSALYHFMFASCMNSCGGGKGSGRPRHFPGKWGPICYAHR